MHCVFFKSDIMFKYKKIDIFFKPKVSDTDKNYKVDTFYLKKII